jgi:hypothetical protein
MSWLAEATKAAGVPKTSIIKRLIQAMAAFDPARDHQVVHASDVTKDQFCARRWAFYGLTNTSPEGQWVGTALRATFDLGHETARVLTEDWAKGFAIGNWECKTCGSQRTMTTRPGDGCPKMGNCNWTYKEVKFESVEYGISGSIDVFFDLGAMNLTVTELKTFAADEFDKMLAPLPEHKTRTRLYLKLIADSVSPFKGKINLHQGRILYVSRGYGRKNEEHGEILPFREFVVDRDDEHPDVVLALQKGKSIKVYREQGLMPGGICATPLDKVAKTCKHCSLCFSGKYPPGKKVPE